MQDRVRKLYMSHMHQKMEPISITSRRDDNNYMAEMQTKRNEILSGRSPSLESKMHAKLNQTSRSALQVKQRSSSPVKKKHVGEEIKPQVQVSMQSGELLCDLMKL